MNRQLKIDADFAGGNIIFDRAEGDTVYVRQDLRDTEGHWFYWYFRVCGAAGRTLRFEFSDPFAIGVHGPAVSIDGGRNWRWLGAGSTDKTGFTYGFAADEEEVRFAMGVPYVQRDLNQWLARHATDRRLVAETLCVSRRGSAVPLLRVQPVTEAKFSVLVTCRHHCCEAMASFTLEGLLDAMLDEDELGRWYAQHVLTVAAPMMDFDGVQAGDQGKNRKPHDHNRDYGEQPIYAEVRALKDVVRGWREAPIGVDLDLHCPWIRGQGTNQTVYLVGSPDAEMWRQQRRLGEKLHAARRGPIEYDAADNLPFGQAWNTSKNDSGLLSHTRWMAQQMGRGVTASIEIPYADVKGRAISADEARLLGRGLAEAVQQYLTDDA